LIEFIDDIALSTYGDPIAQQMCFGIGKITFFGGEGEKCYTSNYIDCGIGFRFFFFSFFNQA